MNNIKNGLEEIIIAGFGGQGVLSLGMTLAYAGMLENKEISWMPSYGPEMRGGTANCITIISENKISSPIISVFDTGLILNQPSMEKFAGSIKPGGLLIYESNSVLHPTDRKDITILPIAASELAHRINLPKSMNMVVLGAYLQLNPVVGLPAVEAALHKVLPEKYHHLIPLNLQALEMGAALAKHSLTEAEIN